MRKPVTIGKVFFFKRTDDEEKIKNRVRFISTC